MANKRNARHYDEPQYHADHPRPVTRRQFVAQGFMSGAAYTSGAGILSLFANPREAAAALSPKRILALWKEHVQWWRAFRA